MYIESEWLSIGNSIDYAGLNRYLTISVVLEHHDLNYDKELQTPPSLEKLKENIFLIKDGGTTNGNLIQKLPLELEDDWTKVHDDYLVFETSILEFLDADLDDIDRLNIQIDENAEHLVKSSTHLVSSITSFLERIDTLLINLQIILLVVNTIVHVFLLLLVLRILNKESKEKIRLEKFATIGQLGSSIAHDLRNPLAVIKGSFDLLKIKDKSNADSFKEKQYLKIDESIKKIEYLSKDILDSVRISELNLEEIGFLQIIEDSLSEIDVPNRIKVKLPENDFKIKVDKIKLESVICNLIKNSIESINGNGAISFHLKDEPDNIVLIVTDTGSGFENDTRSNIFDPLFTTKVNGTGLGLAICKRIIEEHGGKIDVLINPTRFLIYIPK